LTVTSLFTPLLSGKRVWLVAEAAGVDGLVQALQSGERFSLVKLTPAHLEVLAQQLSGEVELGQSSCALVIGGEALLTEQIRLWVEQASEVRLYNEYGPTETVVGCCVYEVGTSSAGLRVPIGRAIGNTRLYILDERQELVPAGVVGELYISGAGVARGYHERAELTAERFVPDPYSGVSGARMYRSGDLAQHPGTGEIEYVGRVDAQVKVRGYRVELGEIEAVLGEQAGVRETVVVQREDEGGGKRLVGYVVSAGEFKSSELREQLLQQLPEYMVPAVFVRLAEMPLTRNGKVDRKALPAPDESRPELEEKYVAPRNETETVLAAIWSEVLGVDQPGTHDNFFELGGHSLLATQVISRVRDTFRVELLLRNLFDATTISQLALLIEEQQAKPAAKEINSLPLTSESSLDVDALLAELEQLSEGEAQSMLQLN
jgi:acyl-coenzyme A synthetase/AMP-(fatty) acid ligase/acyl carrier protein